MNVVKKAFLTPKKILVLSITLVLLGIFSVCGYFVVKNSEKDETKASKITSQAGENSVWHADHDIVKAETKEEVDEYLSKVEKLNTAQAALLRETPEKPTEQEQVEEKKEKKEFQINRFSTLNIREEEIGEADRVINKGNYVIVSQGEDYTDSDNSTYYNNGEELQYKKGTRIIDNSGDNMSTIKTLPETGDLILYDDMLSIMGYKYVTVYDVTDLKNPIKKWQISVDVNENYFEHVYQKDNSLYLVVRNYINFQESCPYEIYKKDGESVMVNCSDIQYPSEVIPIDSLVSILKIDIKDGLVVEKAVIAGTGYYSNIYMTEDNMYYSYFFMNNFSDFHINGLLEEASNILSSGQINELNELKEKDLPDYEKDYQVYNILYKIRQGEDPYNDPYNNNYYYDPYNSYSSYDYSISSEINKALSRYYGKHQRDLQATGIIKLSNNDLAIQDHEIVPGGIRNEFSMDKRGDNLRIAVTLSDIWGSTNQNETNYTTTDLYVLDENLELESGLMNISPREHLSGIRFMEDKAYMVTFERIDPFYVIDLKDGFEPELLGELELDGYSNYLHPLSNDRVFGLGREGSKIKMALFDVSDVKNPELLATYKVSDNYVWSEAIWNHHAFFVDEEKEILFIPTTKFGMIISYKDNKLELKKAIDDINPDRAFYVNNYLYIVTLNKVLIYNQDTWEKVGEHEYNRFIN